MADPPGLIGQQQDPNAQQGGGGFLPGLLNFFKPTDFAGAYYGAPNDPAVADMARTRALAAAAGAFGQAAMPVPYKGGVPLGAALGAAGSAAGTAADAFIHSRLEGAQGQLYGVQGQTAQQMLEMNRALAGLYQHFGNLTGQGGGQAGGQASPDNKPLTGPAKIQAQQGGIAPTQLYSFLLNNGASKNEATMLTSAANAESSFRPDLTHDGGIGYGLFGHNTDRLKSMYSYAGLDPNSPVGTAVPWQQQALFALSELRSGGEQKAGALVNAATTPDQLAKAQMAFERPKGWNTGGGNYEQRLASTTEYFNKPPYTDTPALPAGTQVASATPTTTTDAPPSLVPAPPAAAPAAGGGPVAQPPAAGAPGLLTPPQGDRLRGRQMMAPPGYAPPLPGAPPLPETPGGTSAPAPAAAVPAPAANAPPPLVPAPQPAPAAPPVPPIAQPPAAPAGGPPAAPAPPAAAPIAPPAAAPVAPPSAPAAAPPAGPPAGPPAPPVAPAAGPLPMPPGVPGAPNEEMIRTAKAIAGISSITGRPVPDFISKLAGFDLLAPSAQATAAGTSAGNFPYQAELEKQKAAYQLWVDQNKPQDIRPGGMVHDPVSGKDTYNPAIKETTDPNTGAKYQWYVYPPTSPDGTPRWVYAGQSELGPGQKKTIEQTAEAQPIQVGNQPTQQGPGYTQPIKTPNGSMIPPASGATPISGPKGYLDERAKEYSKTESEWSSSVQPAAEAVNRMQSIMSAMHSYQTGTWATQKSQLVGMLKSVGIDLGDAANDPALAQEILKQNFGASMQIMKSTGLSRWTQAELFATQNATANPDLWAKANHAIGAQTIGTLQWEQQMLSDYREAKKYSPMLDPQDFQARWVADPNNNIQRYIDDASDRIGKLKGETGWIPPEYPVGTKYLGTSGGSPIYQLPNGMQRKG